MSIASRATDMATKVVGIGACALLFGVSTIVALGAAQPQSDRVGDMLVPSESASPARPIVTTPLLWRLRNPAPALIPESKANPAAVADKLAARVHSIEQRARLRAYEGAPPVVPHVTSGMHVQTCRACHAQGLVAGDKVAKMVSHTYLTNCTQCHVEASGMFHDAAQDPANVFAGLRPSGYGGTRAWAGAPPVMPHTTFMRTNCVSCHGEFGYDGWRPDHLSRSNCVQCHAPAAEFDQLAPTFGVPDVPDGVTAAPTRRSPYP